MPAKSLSYLHIKTRPAGDERYKVQLRFASDQMCLAVDCSNQPGDVGTALVPRAHGGQRERPLPSARPAELQDGVQHLLPAHHLLSLPFVRLLRRALEALLRQAAPIQKHLMCNARSHSLTLIEQVLSNTSTT